MISGFPLTAYICLLLLYGTAAAGYLAQKPSFGRFMLKTGVFLNACALSGIVISANRPPLFGTFESVLTIVFCLGAGALYAGAILDEPEKGRAECFTVIAVTVLLLIQAFYPMELNADFYMYDTLWVNLFFLFRLIATGLFLQAGLMAMVSAVNGSTKPRRQDMAQHLGRNFLLLGVAVFLCAEWSGSLWCLNWLGDTWQWSRGFFRGSAVFLLVMLACHLPQGLYSVPIVRALSTTLPGFFCLWMIFFH